MRRGVDGAGERRGVQFARRLYPPRTLGASLGFFCIAAVLWRLETPAWQWALLLFHGFLWPHVAFQLARRSEQPYRAEFRNLMVDSLLGGFWLPLIQFSLVPSALIVVMLGLDNIATGGLRLLLRGLLLNLIGVVLALLLVGFHWQPFSDMTVVVASLPFLLFYPLAIGLITYRLANQLSEQKQRLEQLSRTDGLTGLFNRSYWENCLENEFTRARRLREPVVLLLADVDHFKRINDQFGHAQGDEVLRQVGALLRDSLRRIDVIGRFGGEEFAVVLPHTSAVAGEAVAERLRRAMAGAALDMPGLGPVTISIGVAPLSEDVRDCRSWLARADAALYAAKQQGRNRVVVSAGDDESGGEWPR